MACGARGPMLVESLVVDRIYEVQWRKNKLGLVELAKLRWVEMWSLDRIAIEMNRSRNTIDWGLQKLKKGQLDDLSLLQRTKAKIKSVWRTAFNGK